MKFMVSLVGNGNKRHHEFSLPLLIAVSNATDAREWRYKNKALAPATELSDASDFHAVWRHMIFIVTKQKKKG